MPRPKTTRVSHNKKASTYRSGRLNSTEDLKNPQKITDFFGGSGRKKARISEANETRDGIDSEGSAAEPEVPESGVLISPSPEPASASTSETPSTSKLHTQENLENIQENVDSDRPSTPEQTEPLDYSTTEGKRFDGRTNRDGQSRAQWEKMFSWLYYSHDQQGWKCKLCEEYAVTGDETWKNKAVKLEGHPKRGLENHSRGSKHQNAITQKRAIQAMVSKGNITQQITSSLAKQKQTGQARNQRVVEKLIKSTYFIAKKKWAVKQNFQEFVNFIANLGEEDLRWHCQSSAKNATYLSSTSVEEFLCAINCCLETDLLDKLACCSGFTILADESTDEKDREQLTIFIRYVDRITHKVSEEYLSIVQIKADKTAGSLFTEVMGVLKQKGLEPKEIRFTGFDGTNTMSGEKNGLQRRIRHISPHAIYQNCRNHKLALVFVHIMKKFPLLQQLDKVLLTVWKLFKHSTIKFAVFEEAQAVEGLTPVKILKACTTRWLSHGEACVRILSRWDCLLDSLDTLFANRGEPEVKGCRDQLIEVCLMAVLLADVLIAVNQFSKFLQRKNLDFTSIPARFQKLKLAISELSANLDLGKYFSQARKFVEKNKTRAEMGRRLRREDSFLDHDQSVTETVEQFKQTVARPFLHSLLQELEDAISINNPVLKHFDVFNPSLKPQVSDRLAHLDALIEFYGDTQLDTHGGETNTSYPLINRQEAVGERSDFLQEFDQAYETCCYDFRTEVAKIVREKKIKKMDTSDYIDSHPVESASVFQQMCASGSLTTTKHCMKLFELALLIPPSTANVERGFSAMNLICSSLRASLNQTSLDRFMRINLNGPDSLSESYVKRIAEKWASVKDRRILPC
ncbi:protein FAM200B-like [Liolophura sinensis]|uniref:protein FAM200B-like n=1 Tax=Liolophura sinensis TaxID=3198878 RepID=UPI0031580FFA